MTIDTLLIDLDGTLTDPEIGISRCIRFAMQKLGQPIAEDIALDWCIGPPLKNSFLQLLTTDDEALAEQALAYYRERFAQIGLYENQLYADVSETLAELAQRGYRLFLATAKPLVYARIILQHFELEHYFTGFYGSELSGERSHKGQLIGYLLEQKKLAPAQCMMIGDREHDILGARENQLQCIAVNYGYGREAELSAAAPIARIDRFAELLGYFPSLH